MAKYMIHCAPPRRWFVDGYLYPSLLEQGIAEDDIIIYEDTQQLGNLFAFLDSTKHLPESGSTWHLQDDVIPSDRFREYTESLGGDIITCGFCCELDKGNPSGEVFPFQMWYSFPCISIPNRLVHEFFDWFNEVGYFKQMHQDTIRYKKGDDEIFRDFIRSVHWEDKVLNVEPNLVEHVDFLIGGSLANYDRIKKWYRSIKWEDNGEVSRLIKWLGSREVYVTDDEAGNSTAEEARDTAGGDK